ncbi:adhesin [Pasteurellaceae bacterium LFhippo2]|nr:adhesin [Pasteurellaceae bacterium LFhippo2]
MNNGPSITVNGIDANDKKVTNVASADLTADSKDAVNGSQLYVTNQNVTNVTNEVAKGWNVTTSQSGTGKVTVAPTLANMKMGDTVTVDAGNNIEITQTGKTISIATSATPTFSTVTVGNTTVSDRGVVINGGPSMTVDGIDAGGKTITNVAPGVKGSDAVNLDQLNQVKGDVVNVNNRVNKLDKRVRGIGASSAAASSLPQVYIPGKSMIAAAGGGYSGASAVAVGYSRASDNGKLLLKLQGTANSAGHVSGGVGVGYQW